MPVYQTLRRRFCMLTDPGFLIVFAVGAMILATVLREAFKS
jgi:hypothetical protein